jgi:CHAT domain-containing protein/tetratricopeptide (TPR) repeat protein
MFSLSTAYLAQAKYADAEETILQSIRITERALEGRGGHYYDDDIAREWSMLGVIYGAQGKYAEAEQAKTRALRTMEAAKGPDHPDLAYYIISLGLAYEIMGKYADAEPMFERALGLWETVLGPDHTRVAYALENLASLYMSQRRFTAAGPLYQRALTIRESVVGEEHPLLVNSLSGLAAILEEQETYSEAETIHLRVLEIKESAYGPDHPSVAQSLASIGRMRLEQGDFAQAENLYLRALEVSEAGLGPDHPDVADLLCGLARVHYEAGDYGRAEPLYARALDIEERALGTDHTDIASTLEAMSRLRRAQGRYGEALDRSARAAQIRYRSFADNAPVLAEKDALGYAYDLRASVDNYLTCYVDANGGDAGASMGPADIVFSCKGQVSDEVFERQRSIVEEADSATLALAEDLRLIKFQLSELFVEGPGDELGSYRSRVDSLGALAMALEADLSRQSASFRKMEANDEISAGRISSLLPPNSVLVEYIRYNYLELVPGRQVPGYMVIALDRRDQPAVVNLGRASEIDGLVEKYRTHMLRVASSGQIPTVIDQRELEGIAEELYNLVWKPLEPHVKGRELIMLAPDGALALIPFAGLKSRDRGYLIEDYALHNLASGRDLIRLEEEMHPARGLFALGDPDYGAVASERLASLGTPDDSFRVPDDDVVEMAMLTRNVRSGCGELGETDVSPLPGTRREVELISETWRAMTPEPSVVCYGEEASEEYFKAAAPGKRVIHLATHGYFIGGACGRGEASTDYVGENPLLLSGLFFAGANLHGEGADSLGADDGILTAYEVSAMDLDGTELVVLSACETGLGEVTEGEGVYGLRRAFQIAGARTVVSALWPVSDRATAEMMSDLYQRKDESLPQAIRRVQLKKIEQLRSEGAIDHPFTWGAFIALGDW